MHPILRTAISVASLLWAPMLRAQISPVELQDAVDASFGPWNPVNVDPRGAVYHPWSIESAITLDGVDAARVDSPIQHYLGSELSATVTGPTTLHFSYLCRGSWVIDSWARVQGGLAAPWVNLPAVRGWQEGSIEVGAGSQVVKWHFYDGSGYVPIYLDQIWTENDPRPRITSGSVVEAQKGQAVSYQITTNKPCDLFTAVGLPPGITVDPATGRTSGTLEELGSSDARVTASNAAGGHTKAVLFRVLTPSVASAVSLEAALDGAGLQWTQKAGTGSGVWSGSLTGLARDGVDAATVPLRHAPQAGSSNALRSEIQGPGIFSFWRRAFRYPSVAGDTILGKVRFQVLINGKWNVPSQAQVFGTQWEQRTVSIPQGRHLVELSAQLDSDGWSLVHDALVCFDQASFIAQPQDFTFEEWLSTLSQVVDPAQDLEQDGLPLLVEYALGGSPAFNDAPLLPEAAVIDGHLTMTVHKSPGTSGVEYTVQANKSLASNGWTTFGTEIMDEDQHVLIVRCTKSVTQEPMCMLRLRVRLDDSVGL